MHRTTYNKIAEINTVNIQITNFVVSEKFSFILIYSDISQDIQNSSIGIYNLTNGRLIKIIESS